MDDELHELAIHSGNISLLSGDSDKGVKLTHVANRLESLIRDSLAANDHDRIAKVVHQLCHDYAYAVHQPHARNGGLIGLAAAAIALGGVRGERPGKIWQWLKMYRKSQDTFERLSHQS